MPSCAFDKCTNHTRKDHKADGVTFHALPVDESTKLKWITLLRKQRREFDWLPTQHTRVCSMHFRPEQIYTTSKGYTRIKKTAVPFFRSESRRNRVKKEKTEISERPMRSRAEGEKNDADSDDDPLRIPRCDSPSNLSDSGSSDLDSIDAAVLSLKKKLREKEQISRDLKKKLRKKENICKRHIKEIKLLQKSHKRLSEKNMTLKKVLVKIKRKLLNRNSVSDAKDDADNEESNSS